MGTQIPPKGTHFSAHVYCGQTAGWVKMPFGTKVDLGPGDIVLDGDPAPPRKRGTAAPSNFPPVSIDQTAGWIKMLLGTDVGLGTGDVVLDVDPAAPSPKMDQDATWCGGRPRPRRHCVRWDPASHTERGTAAAHFSAHVYCRQTVAHLSYC